MNPKNKTIKIVKVRKQVRKMYTQKATLCKKSTKQTKNYKEKKETKKKKKTRKKINYKRGENKGTKGENH